MTLQALRAKIGDEKFFQTLKDYVATFGGGTASTDDFIAIAQRDSGQDLRDFFKQWLYTPGKPNETYCYCVAPADQHVDGRRQRAGDAGADARHAADVRAVHARAWPRTTRPRRPPT